MIKLNLPEDSDIDRSSGTAVLEQEPQVKEPPMYQVLLLNDDYTPCLLYTSPSPRDDT